MSKVREKIEGRRIDDLALVAKALSIDTSYSKSRKYLNRNWLRRSAFALSLKKIERAVPEDELLSLHALIFPKASSDFFTGSLKGEL